MIRPVNGIVAEKEETTKLGHELCVIFPCGEEVAVNRNIEYSLKHFQKDANVIPWACELLIYRQGCARLITGWQI